MWWAFNLPELLLKLFEFADCDLFFFVEDLFDAFYLFDLVGMLVFNHYTPSFYTPGERKQGRGRCTHSASAWIRFRSSASQSTNRRFCTPRGASASPCHSQTLDTRYHRHLHSPTPTISTSHPTHKRKHEKTHPPESTA